MPTPTHVLLFETTVSSSVTSITIGSIDQSFADLVLVIACDVASGNLPASIKPNGDSGQSFNVVGMVSGGSSYYISESTTGDTFGTNTSIGRMGVLTMEILDYSKTNKFKSCLAKEGHDGQAAAYVSTYKSNQAITSIQWPPVNGSNLPIGTKVAIYGIEA